MASFDLAFRRTMGHEAGYADDPLDRGGETWRGVSRRAHPSWDGWAIVDRIKADFGSPIDIHDLTRRLLADHELESRVKSLYRVHYWNRIHGDDVPSQAIAEELFDSAVNMGIERVVAWLQAGMNVLNRGGRLYDDLRADGRLGPLTMAALHAYLSTEPPGHLLKLLNIAQGHHYFDLALRRPDQERFIRGWLARVSLSKRGGLDRANTEEGIA